MPDDNILNPHHEDTAIVEDETQAKLPPQYKVLLHNDDYTPMDFVVKVLQKFFHLELEEATKIMLLVHNTGLGLCGTFSKEIAETKVKLVTTFARQHQHPLKCTMEMA